MEFLKSNWMKTPIVLYVLGFVVHNNYLSNFGNYEFELVQAKYILSGFGIICFYSICLAYASIKVNISGIYQTFKVDNLLPWLLRVFSLPYVIYIILYHDLALKYLVNNHDFLIIPAIFMVIAINVVVFTISDLAFMFSKQNVIIEKIISFFFRILSIPLILVTVGISYISPEFSSIVKCISFIFFGFIGIALRQSDEVLGIEPEIIHNNSKENHKDLYSLLFGIIAISFILWIGVSSYTKAIYTQIPVALGGARAENVEIFINGKPIESMLIQETDKWILYINKETKTVEKIKSNIVEKVIYLNANKHLTI